MTTIQRSAQWRRLAATAAMVVLVAGCGSVVDAVSETFEARMPEPEVLGSQVEASADGEIPEVFVFPGDEPEAEADSETAAAVAPPAAPGRFTSTDDVGRLFETDGAVLTVEVPGTSRGPVRLDDGTLVSAAASSTVDGRLWVQLAEPTDPDGILGWLPAEFLRGTLQVAADFHPEVAGYFFEIATSGRDGEDLVLMRAGPGRSFDRVAQLPAGSLVLRGGASAIDAWGDEWANIADPASKHEIGWVHSEFLEPAAPSVRVRNADGSAALSEHTGRWESGANIEQPSIVGIGCDTIQVAVTSASSHEAVSSHLLFGDEPPSAPSRQWEDPKWDLGAETRRVYIRPGDTVIFTLPAPQIDEPKRYYFLQLDSDDRAATAFDFNSDAIRTAGGDLTPSGVYEVRAVGAC